MSYTLLPIAVTDERFADFSPYVPSISNAGTVAFQAGLVRGGSTLYAGSESAVTQAIDTADGDFDDVTSHPDINSAGDRCFYAKRKNGEWGVFLISRGQLSMLAPSCGPLGPTMNEAGTVAFRAKTQDGAEGIFAGTPKATRLIAEVGLTYAAFHGLPVIRADGAVLFRADTTVETQGIFLGNGSTTNAIVETGAEFESLAAFPTMNDAGTVVFAATLRGGQSGIFAASHGKVRPLVNPAAGFESFRGALINNAGTVIFYATPVGKTLGIFSGPDPERDRILAIGEAFSGSTITEFALNPVSINDAGQLAIRLRLADERQFIVRADPSKNKNPQANGLRV